MGFLVGAFCIVALGVGVIFGLSGRASRFMEWVNSHWLPLVLAFLVLAVLVWLT